MLYHDLRHLRAQAYQYLVEADRPLPPHRLTRYLFGPRRHERPEAQVVLRTLLAGDPRFLETHDQRWCARGTLHMAMALGKATYAVVDLETTGSIIGVDEIIEIGVVILRRRRVVHRFSSLVHSDRVVPIWVSKLTGIRNSDLQQAPTFPALADELSELLSDVVFVAHDIRFDLPFLRWEYARHGRAMPSVTGLCTLCLSRLLWPDLPNRNLTDLARHFDIQHTHPHRAAADADATAALLVEALQAARRSGYRKLSDLFRRPAGSRRFGMPANLQLATEASD